MRIEPMFFPAHRHLTLAHKITPIANNKLKITLIESKREIEVDATIAQMHQAYNELIKGRYIQDAYYFLNASEREFLKTGMTDEEWERLAIGIDNFIN